MKSEKRVSDVLGICRLPGAVPFSPKLLLIFEQADALPDPSQYPVPAHLWQEVCPSTQEEGGEDGKEEEKGRERGMNLIKNRCLHTCDSVFQKKKEEGRQSLNLHSFFIPQVTTKSHSCADEIFTPINDFHSLPDSWGDNCGLPSHGPLETGPSSRSTGETSFNREIC